VLVHFIPFGFLPRNIKKVILFFFLVPVRVKSGNNSVPMLAYRIVFQRFSHWDEHVCCKRLCYGHHALRPVVVGFGKAI
jgi:hypothetical protein